MRKKYLQLASALAVLPSRSFVGGIAPENLYLAGGAWPLAHHDSYAQGSSNFAAVTDSSSATVDILFDMKVAGPLTVLFTEDGLAMWGSSYMNIFKVDRTGPRMKIIDTIPKDESMAGDMFRGIYSFLSNYGTFYVCGGKSIAAYTDLEAGNSLSKIQPVGKYMFRQAKDSENIISITMSYDGFVVFLTTMGRVGVVTRNLRHLVALNDLSEETPEGIEVTNSMAIDEFGGIYVVSSRYMHRVWWDSSDQILRHSTPGNHDQYDCTTDNYTEDQPWWCASWTSPYDVEETPFKERPTQFGSGTTPSIVKDEPTGKAYVAIADGSRRQSILIFDCASGEVAAKAFVRFTNGSEHETTTAQTSAPLRSNRGDKSTAGESKSTANVPSMARLQRRRSMTDDLPIKQESYTEQSLLVHQNRIVVVENAFTASAQRVQHRVDEFLTHARGPQSLPESVATYAHLLPVVLGDAPVGLQQFALNMSKPFDQRLESKWIQNEFGCPNAIPTMSVPSNAMYCVGKLGQIRGRSSYPVDYGFRGSWSMQGIDWDTGKLLFSSRTGSDLRFNSFYAATQIGPDGELFYGAIGGIVRLRPHTPLRNPTRIRSRTARRRARRSNAMTGPAAAP